MHSFGKENCKNTQTEKTTTEKRKNNVYSTMACETAMPLLVSTTIHYAICTHITQSTLLFDGGACEWFPSYCVRT